uniref:Rap guanine nucleotide exchange factor 5 n=1 Tax=Amphiprion percula TaxID=161767 RepID=A0A3P8TIY3_AMPPE
MLIFHYGVFVFLFLPPLVDQRVVFSDSNSYYQFSFEECDSASCEFRSNEGEWPEAVKLLVQLAPYVQFRSGGGANSPVSAMSWDCGLRYVFMPPVLQLGGVCALRDGGGGGGMGSMCGREELTSRLGLEAVQRLAKDGCRLLQNHNYRLPDRNQAVSKEDCCDPSSYRYVVVSGTPLKILEHLLSDLRLDDQRGAPENRESEMLLDDFLLTYLVFMSTHDLCQALLGQYPFWGQEEGKDALFRKRKVLQLVSHWSRLYKDFLKEEEHVRSFMKTLYRCVLEDLYEFPTLEKDLKEFQKLLRRRQRASTCYCVFYISPISLISAMSTTQTFYIPLGWLYTLGSNYHYHHQLCLLLCPLFVSAERRVLQPSDCVYSESLTPQGKLVACRRDLTEILPPLTDSAELSRRPVRLLGINTWDVAAALTHLDWSLFKSIHEQELVYYTLSRAPGTGHTAALSVLLQRCNEVQQWVMSEVLMCVSLNKRVQLLKKFIKIAAHCKAQRNLNSAFAIIMGLNTAAVSRLNQTWEKCPGKFKKLFSELELITDPSLNHKAYREAFKRMKPPKIPFMPLLLKDITFIHEGNKTFHDNLVNFEKLHMIADTVRMIRHCQSDQPGDAEVRASVHYLHIIDNQQTLFELSHKLEPRA